MNPLISSAILFLVVIVLYFVYKWLRSFTLVQLVAGLIGIISGLAAGALVSVPMHSLPEPVNVYGPAVATILLLAFAFSLAIEKRDAIAALLPKPKPVVKPQTNVSVEPGPTADGRRAVVDTSAIIDGRIADVAEAGFAPSILIVPRFVLAELQNIADSEDSMRRGRGRRGLEVLNRLREMTNVTVEVTDEDAPQIREVDAKLVALAQRFGCDVLTTDYNLNRVAQIQGVHVLNVNELSNAIRPVVLPGEEMVVKVVQPGKERNQGVGYLADGTMIVVENGDKLMDQDVAVEVTRVFQTVAGKMIFAAPKHAIPAMQKPKQQQPAAPAQAPAAVAQPQPQYAQQRVAHPQPAAAPALAAAEHETRAQANNQLDVKPVPRTDRPGRQYPARNSRAQMPSTAMPAAAPAASTQPMAARDNQNAQQPRRRRSASSAIEDRLIQATQNVDDNQS